MYSANVEIYSDQPNAAVMRHPDRRFPGVLVQGDTLRLLAQQAADSLAVLPTGAWDAMEELEDLKSRLEALVEHYESAMAAHGLELPYVR